MATVNCPHRHRWISQLPGNITFEFRDVEIFAGVCGSCHKCGFRECEYFDESEEAQKRRWNAWIATHTDIRGQLEDEHYERMLRAKHHRLYGTSRMPT
jgi:hypothetical protein